MGQEGTINGRLRDEREGHGLVGGVRFERRTHPGRLGDADPTGLESPTAEVEIRGRSRHTERFEDGRFTAAVLTNEKVHAAEIQFKIVDRLEVSGP